MVSSEDGVKFICETHDMTQLPPSIIANHAIVNLPEGMLTTEQLVKR